MPPGMLLPMPLKMISLKSSVKKKLCPVLISDEDVRGQGKGGKGIKLREIKTCRLIRLRFMMSFTYIVFRNGRKSFCYEYYKTEICPCFHFSQQCTFEMFCSIMQGLWEFSGFNDYTNEPLVK